MSEVAVLPTDDGATEGKGLSKNKHYSWATLLKRVFEIDILNCPCGGTFKMKEAIFDEDTMKLLLGEQGIGLDPPPIWQPSTFRYTQNFDF